VVGDLAIGLAEQLGERACFVEPVLEAVVPRIELAGLWRHVADVAAPRLPLREVAV